MKNTAIGGLAVLALVLVGFVSFNSYSSKETESVVSESNYKDVEYIIDGKSTRLTNETRYFGNELVTDLNADGRDDVVFLVTQEPGGSGTFYYTVAALNTENGYVGSEAYLLGDRIAPQNIELSRNPAQESVIVVNYADRVAEAPMATPPTVGKSAYIKLDTESMEWGSVEPAFEGEADSNVMSLGMKTWVWTRALYNDGREIVPSKSGAFTLTFKRDGTVAIGTDCNGAAADYIVSGSSLTFPKFYKSASMMYCDSPDEKTLLQLLEDTSTFHFTSKGELVLSLKFDSGTVTFQ
jgi:heat shock protein HslJ